MMGSGDDVGDVLEYLIPRDARNSAPKPIACTNLGRMENHRRGSRKVIFLDAI
jgi:hypothetical protein